MSGESSGPVPYINPMGKVVGISIVVKKGGVVIMDTSECSFNRSGINVNIRVNICVEIVCESKG